MVLPLLQSYSIGEQFNKALRLVLKEGVQNIVHFSSMILDLNFQCYQSLKAIKMAKKHKCDGSKVSSTYFTYPCHQCILLALYLLLEPIRNNHVHT